MAASFQVADVDFYYYQGQPIPLDVDSSRFVVASALEAPAAAIREALGSLSPTRIERLDQFPDHWVIHVSGPSSSSFASALTRLQADNRFAFASRVYRFHEDHTGVVLLNRLLVQFKSGTSRASIDSLVSGLGMRIIREPQPSQGFLWHLLAYPPHLSPLGVVAALYKNPLVQTAEPDFLSERRALNTSAELYPLPPMSVPTDPYYSWQYDLKNTVYMNGVPVDDNVEPAWNLTTGSGVKVAILDTGIDSTQADLCGGSHSSANGRDAFNYYGESAWHPFLNSIDDVHGTAIAGIIAACQSNGLGIAGIAPDVTLISVRIVRADGHADNDQLAAAINWAWSTAQADVLSCSCSLDPTDQITAAFNGAASQGRGGRGAAVVIAAGNTAGRDTGYTGFVTYPATLSSTLSVGAIDRNGYLANYTPRGRISLVAPSSHYHGMWNGDLTTLDFAGMWGLNNGPNSDVNCTKTYGGTSAAAPQVAAAAALLFSLYPAMSWADAASRIASKSDYWGPAGDYGAGKLNIYHVLVPPLYNWIYEDPPSYTAEPTGGVPPYSYYWEFCITNCEGPAAPVVRDGVSPNGPIEGWQYLSTNQMVTWSRSQSYLRNTVTDSRSQQAEAQIYVP